MGAAFLLLILLARRAPRGGAAFAVLSAAVWVLAGWGSGAAAQRPRAGHLATAPAGSARVHLDHPVLAEFRVTAADRVEGERRIADVRLASVSRGSARRVALDRVRLDLPSGAPRLLEGDRLRAWITLRRREPFANGLPAPRLDPPLGGRLKSSLLIERHRTGGGPGRILAGWRRFLLARLDTGLARGGAAPRVRGLAAAVILGERAAVSRDDRQRLADGGAAHVLAVSGLHMTAVIGLLTVALTGIGLGRRRAALLVLAAIPAYVLLLPLRPSVARAALMGLCLPAARLRGRGAAPLNLLGAAGMVLLLLWPALVRDAGFALSFAVTAALIRLAGLGERPSGSWSPPALLCRLLSASLVATAAGLPLTAYFFGRVTPGAVVTNLIAVPAATVLVITCAAATVLAAVHPVLAAPAAPVASLAVHALFAAADWPPRMPGGHLLVPPGRALLVLATLGALLSSRRGAAGWRVTPLLGALTGQALLLGGCLPPSPLPPGTLTLRALDVGQGDALLLGLPDGGALLVDGGGFAGSDLDPGRQVVLPALQAAGVRRLAAVALTHAHHDHGMGLEAVLEEMPVSELWLPGIPPGDDLTARLVQRAVDVGTAVRVLHAGDRLQRGGAQVICLGPEPGRRRAPPNDRSLVLQLETMAGSVLLPGDLEADGEARLIASGLPPVAVLKVPHHGSASSSTGRFLDALRPRIAVISVGRSNPWGHPSPEVLRRLRFRGALVLRTDRHGAVTVSLSADGVRWGTVRVREP